MILALALSATLASSPATCESLKSLSLPNTTIVAAEMVAAGPFTPPAPRWRAGRTWCRGQGGRGGPAAPPQIVPAHCRVNAILRPSPDSEIEMEAWLPENWNGKFQFVGGGGWAGIISFPAMVTAVQEGYATASTDTGHKGGNALFAIGHPEKVVDFAYRAVHETTVQTKALITKFYDRGAAAVVLERLLDRRTPGPDGSAEVSRKTSTRSSPARRRTSRRTCTRGISASPCRRSRIPRRPCRPRSWRC